MTTSNPSPRDIFIGELRHEFSLSLDEKWILDTPGGNAVYAAAGYLLWDNDQYPGICTRVGEDYHHEWLEDFEARGINTEGVVVLPKALDLRICYVQKEDRAEEVGNPVAHFSKAGVALPQVLVGYSKLRQVGHNRRVSKETAIRERDLPASYFAATGAHICPLDYLSHNLLPAILRGQGFSTITLEPCSAYMDANFLGDIPALMPGLTAFLPSEEDLKNLYKGISVDVWEMAEEISRFGCEIIVIKRGAGGQYLYEGASGRKWEIPAYPSRVKNSIGVGDTFCGGFLAGFRQSFDPLQAVMHGNVAASLAIEGSGPFFLLDALPGLAEARLHHLKETIKEI
jgi:sugar/nucleoside kinase (ribokinase family)